jgi:hypothetical protein
VHLHAYARLFRGELQPEVVQPIPFNVESRRMRSVTWLGGFAARLRASRRRAIFLPMSFAGTHDAVLPGPRFAGSEIIIIDVIEVITP